MTRLVVAMSGASGAIYGVRLLHTLSGLPHVETHLVVTEASERAIVDETGQAVRDVEALARARHDAGDVGAPPASAGFAPAAVVIAPCDMTTATAIAAGRADDLVTRIAAAALRERRTLVLLVHETPLGVDHLRSLLALADRGAVVLPPVPAFYNRPREVDDIVNHTVARVLDRLRLPQSLVPEWTGTAGRVPTGAPGA